MRIHPVAGTDLVTHGRRERAQAASASQQVEPAIIENSDDEEEELRSYEPIDLLQDAGINATDIAKLKEDGFATIGQLFQVSHKKLLAVKGISEAKVDKVSDLLSRAPITLFATTVGLTVMNFTASASWAKGEWGLQ